MGDTSGVTVWLKGSDFLLNMLGKTEGKTGLIGRNEEKELFTVVASVVFPGQTCSAELPK